MYWPIVQGEGKAMIDSYTYFIVLLLPLTAFMVIFQSNPYHAIVLRGILGAMAALVYAVLGAPDVALTEALVGTMLAVTLYAIAIRSSFVLRVGILVNEENLGQLRDEVQAAIYKYYLRLELVAYADTEALQQALDNQDIHGTYLHFPDATHPYQITISIPYLYEMIKAELASSTTHLTLVSPSYSEGKK